MNAQLGHALVLLALVAAAAGGILGLVAGARQDDGALTVVEKLTYLFAAAMGAANLVMVRALVAHDFSVSYVAQVGSRATPLVYTIVSLWSSLEGSILFWGAILGAYLAAFVALQRGRQRPYMGYALGVALLVSAFFAFLIAGPANPFVPLSPVPDDGPGPNALLQNHVLMVIHPPLLYLGYVGMTLPFAIAVAALLRGSLGEGWLKTLRRWTIAPWMFLSVGIILGSWWAYEVLGWGGFWAWDPVENASFLPWLAATGYLHSTVVQERRRILKAWTLSLVLAAFLLTILGTFMTRSGVFNSVHSFTQSPIGPVFLAFLAVALVASVLLLALRGHLLEAEGHVSAVLSRETAFLLNNVLFVALTFTVLLGTVFPLVTEAVEGTKVSVGEPYFNRMAVPLGLMMVMLMGVGPVLPWGRPNLAALRRDFLLPLAVGVATAVLSAGFGAREPLGLLTFGLCGFAAFTTLREIATPVVARIRGRGEAPSRALIRAFSVGRRRMGGYVVHLGVIVVVAGIAGAQLSRQSREASLAVGESMALDRYTLTFLDASGRDEAQRFAVVARIRVAKDGKVLGDMEPRLNFYPSQREPIGTPHVVTLGHTDLYVSLVAVERDGQRVGIKVFLIPMVAWIWRSMPLWVLGAMISMWPRRRARLPAAPEPAGAAVAAAP